MGAVLTERLERSSAFATLDAGLDHVLRSTRGEIVLVSGQAGVG
ncbi:MAG TPA: hypothetical protein VGL99_00040 [Chloroflexota bacterium]